MAVSIAEQGDHIVVGAPYHPNFPARARLLGADWDAVRHVWIFDAREAARVRSLCREIYGTDGADRAAGIVYPDGHGRNEFAEGVAVPHYFGHRQRLRERMIASGAESLPDYELLEVILFAARVRGDVKPVAKALLAHFGGFAEMMSAEPDALAAAGLNLAGIAAITAAREAALRLMRAELQQRPVVNSWDKLIDYCSAQVSHGKIEEFHILFLDRRNVLIKDERQQRGTIDHTPVYPREVVKRALELGASAIIMVHNHPSGDTTPSKADIEMTRTIAKALTAIGIALHDHVVIGRNRHTSLRELGEI